MLPAIIAAMQTGPIARIPFELTGRHPYVALSINGRGPYHFIFDTGASATVINSARAGELGLRSSGSIPAGGAGAGTVLASVYHHVRLPAGKLPAGEITAYGISLDRLSQGDGR